MPHEVSFDVWLGLSTMILISVLFKQRDSPFFWFMVAVTKPNCSLCTCPICQWRVVFRPRRIYMRWENSTTSRAFQKHDGPLSTADECTNHISASKERRIYLDYLELAETSVSQRKRCSHNSTQLYTGRFWDLFTAVTEHFHKPIPLFISASVSIECRIQFSACLSAALCWFHVYAPHFEPAFCVYL